MLSAFYHLTHLFPKTAVTLGAIIILILEIRKQTWKGSQVQIIVKPQVQMAQRSFPLLLLWELSEDPPFYKTVVKGGLRM